MVGTDAEEPASAPDDQFGRDTDPAYGDTPRAWAGYAFWGTSRSTAEAIGTPNRSCVTVASLCDLGHSALASTAKLTIAVACE